MFECCCFKAPCPVFFSFIVFTFTGTLFEPVTTHTPLSAQSSNFLVFRLQPAFIYLFLLTYVIGTHLNCLDLFRQLSTTSIYFKKYQKNTAEAS